MRLIAACVLIVAACGSSKPRPAAPPSNVPVAEVEPAPPADPPPHPPGRVTDAEFEALMQHAIVMFNAMGDAADAAGNDCDKLAVRLEQVLADHAGFLTAVKKYKDDPDMDRRGQEWIKLHQDEVMAPMMKVAGAGQKCSSNAHFMEVMRKLGEMGD